MPEQTFVNPNGALDGGGRLARIGGDFATQWAALETRFRALHKESAWGTDQVGAEFVKQYQPDATETGAGGVLSGLTTLAAALKELGPQVIHAVNGTVETDDQTRTALQA